MHHSSKRIRRVARSTLTCETLSVTSLIDEVAHLRALWSWWVRADPKVFLHSDCLSLVEAVEKIDIKCTEKRLRLDMLDIQEYLRPESKNRATFSWVDTRVMLANPLTKGENETRTEKKQKLKSPR